MKRIKIDLQSAFEQLAKNKAAVKMKKTTAESLDLDYAVLLPQAVADELMRQLEDGVEYYEGALTKVKVFGRWHEIPRQQVAYGDDGMEYAFSGTSLPAKPWTPLLNDVRNLLFEVTGFRYNFVLVNRYRNGKDHIGEHRDDEKELDKNTPIASVSLGQKRAFVVKHGDARKKGTARRDIPTGRELISGKVELKLYRYFLLVSVKLELEHGSLLLMNPPTNEHWYHSVPQRKLDNGVRINLTFRKINKK